MRCQRRGSGESDDTAGGRLFLAKDRGNLLPEGYWVISDAATSCRGPIANAAETVMHAGEASPRFARSATRVRTRYGERAGCAADGSTRSTATDVRKL